MLISVRKAGERGRTKLDWLESRHSFAFGGYVDGEHWFSESRRAQLDYLVKLLSLLMPGK